MTRLDLAGRPLTALAHLAPLGLTSILRDGPDRTATSWWDIERGVAVVESVLDELDIGAAVRKHAERRSEDSWLAAKIEGGTRRGMSLFSPRIKTAPNDDEWRTYVDERHRWLTAHEAELTSLDHRLLAALGTPAWWRADRRDFNADEGASRWEMKTRNKGQEFMADRLLPLTRVVAARESSKIVDGLVGRTRVDELGKDAAASRTVSGLTVPGPEDSALVYAALYGIASLPTIHRVAAISSSAGMVPRRGVHPNHGFLPIFSRPVSPRRFRSVVASRTFDQLAASLVDRRPDDRPLSDFLREQGVHAVLVCDIRKTGTSSAPERQVLDGRVHVV